MTITPEILQGVARGLAKDYVELLACDPNLTPARIEVAARQIVDLEEIQRSVYSIPPLLLHDLWLSFSQCRDGLAQYMIEHGIRQPN